MRIILNGSSGHMGKLVAELAEKTGDDSIVAGIDNTAPAVPPPFPVFTRFADCNAEADVLIDFSRPEALGDILSYAQAHNLPCVIGTTGLSPGDRAAITQAAVSIPVFVSANMSLGTNLQMDLARRSAAFLGDDFEVEILEKHHNRKVDAPSGTALLLADALSEEYTSPRKYVYERHSRREKRAPNEIGIHSLRGGTIVGEHQICFIGTDEIVEIRHIAQSRSVFAAGALRAAAFVVGRPPRLYTMHDVVATFNAVTSVYKKEDQAMISLGDLSFDSDAVHMIFQTIADSQVNLDMITQSAPVCGHVRLAFTLPQNDLPAAKLLLKPLCEQHRLSLDVQQDIAKLSVEGAGMEYHHGIAAKMFGALAQAQIDILLVATSETKISCCVPSGKLDAAYQVLLQAFQLTAYSQST